MLQKLVEIMPDAVVVSAENLKITYLGILRKRRNFSVYKTSFDRNFCHPQLMQVQSDGS